MHVNMHIATSSSCQSNHLQCVKSYLKSVHNFPKIFPISCASIMLIALNCIAINTLCLKLCCHNGLMPTFVVSEFELYSVPLLH